jgi:hypothetical protein
MQTATDSQARRLVARLQRIRTEVDYAQRRLFEIRTGIPAPKREEPTKLAHPVTGGGCTSRTSDPALR